MPVLIMITRSLKVITLYILVQVALLYSWKFLLNSAQSYWLLRGHMTSNNETVSHHHGNNAKKRRQRVTMQSYQRMLTDDRRYSEF